MSSYASLQRVRKELLWMTRCTVWTSNTVRWRYSSLDQRLKFTKQNNFFRSIYILCTQDEPLHCIVAISIQTACSEAGLIYFKFPSASKCCTTFSPPHLHRCHAQQLVLIKFEHLYNNSAVGGGGKKKNLFRVPKLPPMRLMVWNCVFCIPHTILVKLSLLTCTLFSWGSPFLK